MQTEAKLTRHVRTATLFPYSHMLMVFIVVLVMDKYT
jgi:hypothetical protein